MKIAVVGATGLVGTEMLRVLTERQLPISELIPVASEKSIGQALFFQEKEYHIVSAQDAIAMKPAIALFSAGGSVSLALAPLFAEAGIKVIDNSSAWRMNPDIKLVVPEVNGHVLNNNDWIIANPNCSTIQMVMCLKPLHDAFKIKRVVVSTYQSVTGTGAKAVQQLNDERAGIAGEKVYPYPIDLNVIPQIDVFTENGYTKEEMKMIRETNKIMGDDSIAVTATTVRIPVMGGHSESVNIEFEHDFDLPHVRQLLSKFPGVIVQDNPTELLYPMPLNSQGKDAVFVGRIRRDESQKNSLNLWIVADNLRKGAATNAVQIAQYLIDKKMI
ncbi:MAG: aspartate-semialdehyde dehydrogenase [Chitinophagaceae bacterium]|nr:aspartate-semialdehyde dehydrogenase [Chitinophagaceae bacterium]